MHTPSKCHGIITLTALKQKIQSVTYPSSHLNMTGSVSQNAVLKPAAAALPRNLLGMQIIRPHLKQSLQFLFQQALHEVSIHTEVEKNHS